MRPGEEPSRKAANSTYPLHQIAVVEPLRSRLEDELRQYRGVPGHLPGFDGLERVEEHDDVQRQIVANPP